MRRKTPLCYETKDERINAVGLAVQSGLNAINMVSRSRSNLLCSHCGRTNHTVETCFIKHGYPEGWFDSNNEGRGRGRGRGCGRGRSAPPRANNAQAQVNAASSEVSLPKHGTRSLPY